MRKTILVACAFLLAPLPAAAQTSVNGQPSGEGDPAAIVCRPPQIVPGSRRRGPEVCKTNAVWAQYREDGMMVSEDGSRDIAVAKGKNCQSGGSAGGSGISSTRGMGASITCE